MSSWQWCSLHGLLIEPLTQSEELWARVALCAANVASACSEGEEKEKGQKEKKSKKITVLLSRGGQITLGSEDLTKRDLLLCHFRIVSVKARSSTGSKSKPKSHVLATWALNWTKTRQPKIFRSFGGQHKGCGPIYSPVNLELTRKWRDVGFSPTYKEQTCLFSAQISLSCMLMTIGGLVLSKITETLKFQGGAVGFSRRLRPLIGDGLPTQCLGEPQGSDWSWMFQWSPAALQRQPWKRAKASQLQRVRAAGGIPCWHVQGWRDVPAKTPANSPPLVSGQLRLYGALWVVWGDEWARCWHCTQG